MVSFSAFQVSRLVWTRRYSTSRRCIQERTTSYLSRRRQHGLVVPTHCELERRAPVKRDLRELYTIDAEADIPCAIEMAKASTRSLKKYLQFSPVPAHTRVAFDTFLKWRRRPSARTQLCIDAGCGQGWSALRLAHELPDCDVVGVDKSAVRLHRNAAYRHGGVARETDNALLLRADLIPFWRLCWQHGIRPTYHYILYPNPYPKPSDLKVSFLYLSLNPMLHHKSSHPRYIES